MNYAEWTHCNLENESSSRHYNLPYQYPETLGKLSVPPLEDTPCLSTETFFGHVHNRMDCYILAEAVAAGVLKPYMMNVVVRPKSGSVYVVEHEQVFKDGCVWSNGTVTDSFLTFREVKKDCLEKEQRRTKKHERGLVKRVLSITASNNETYQLVSYFSFKDFQLLYSKEMRASSVCSRRLQRPSGMLQYQQFIVQWTQFKRMKYIQDAIHAELTPLPPSLLPFNNGESQFPADNWDGESPNVERYSDTLGDVELPESLILPPSALPLWSS
ncbi:hypothetical protein BDR26DRAFT_1011209 [Obelidium mucronatum]|nr:hypothetical protein BDR26DRAFT_1011209 [Obelidium mucronatum]